MEREKIVKLFCGFLVLMVVCTLLSRAASSMTVARVKVARPSNVVINHKVTGEGSVKQNREQAVATEADQMVETIYVNPGQQVEKGEVLFKVSIQKLNEQILECRQELARLKLESQDAGSKKSIDEEKKGLARNRAIEDYNRKAANEDQSVAWAEAELNNACDRLNEYYGSTEWTQGSGESEDSFVDAVNSARKAYDEALSAREESLVQAERAIQDAEQEEAADSTLSIKEIELKQKELKLKKLELLAEAKGTVAAPVGGIVTKVNILTGEKTTDQAAILLADLSSGCKFVAEVEKTNEKYLEKGMEVTLEHAGTKKILENQKLQSVEAKKEDTGVLEVVVLLSAEDAEIGSTLKMTAEKKSKTYQTGIPIQAIQEENGKSYVYVLEEQKSILGKIQAIRQVEVMVEEKDDYYAALSEGSLGKEQQVVISADRTIENGSRARLEDS